MARKDSSIKKGNSTKKGNISLESSSQIITKQKADTKPLVVFVHGFGGFEFECFPLMQVAKAAGFEVALFSYKLKFGEVSIAHHAYDLKKFIDLFWKKPVAIIGFSQGGIIASYYLEKLGGKRRCSHCVAMCSPFHGTVTAHLLQRVGVMELRPKSLLLKELRERMVSSSVLYKTLWTPLDLMVVPGTSARFIHPTKILCPFHGFVPYWPKTKSWLKVYLSNLVRIGSE